MKSGSDRRRTYLFAVVGHVETLPGTPPGVLVFGRAATGLASVTVAQYGRHLRLFYDIQSLRDEKKVMRNSIIKKKDALDLAVIRFCEETRLFSDQS